MRRVLFNPGGGGGGGGGGGWVHIPIQVSWVRGGKHCKLHAFVHVLRVHYYLYIYMINIHFLHGIS